jgi:hypothetical protein
MKEENNFLPCPFCGSDKIGFEGGYARIVLAYIKELGKARK